MTRPPAGKLRAAPAHLVRDYAQRIRTAIDAGATQEAIAEGVGVEQPSISRLLGVLRGSDYAPGIVYFNRLRAYFGDGPEDGLTSADGMPPAELADTMTANRGRAIALLSQDQKAFPGELLKAISRRKAPAGHERWTWVRWAEYFFAVKSAWQSGTLDLPGYNRS